MRNGLRSQDLLLDPLVLTLASGQDSAVQTLRTLAMYKETFGFPTVMGLSNVVLWFAATTIFKQSIFNNGCISWFDSTNS